MDLQLPIRTPSMDAMDQARRTLIDLTIRHGPRVLTAILILLIGFFVARRFGKLGERLLSRRDLEQPVRQLISRLIGLFVIIIFTMMALQNLGVELLPLLASLGVVGVGAGLAMQGVLANLVAGLTIIFTQPFRVGEYISVIEVEGQVDTIDLFNTVLLHPDRSRVVIPNRKLIGEVLHNYGKIRQLDLAVGVAYATDLNRAIAVIAEVLQHRAVVLQEPVPIIGVTTLGESAITIAVRPWVNVAERIEAIGEINQAIVEACRQHKIEIALPQSEVRLLNAPVPDKPTAPPARPLS
jgi:small conductance mechanosensitive channel